MTKKRWVKLGWFIVLALLVQLTFAERGLVDLYQLHGKVQAQQQRLIALRLTLQHFEQEIALIRTETTYQRLLVRRQLGFIKDDEYLLIFPSERVHDSI